MRPWGNAALGPGLADTRFCKGPVRPGCAFVRRKRTAEPTLRFERWFLSGCYRKAFLGQMSQGHPLVPVLEEDRMSLERTEALVVGRAARAAMQVLRQGLRRDQ